MGLVLGNILSLEKSTLSPSGAVRIFLVEEGTLEFVLAKFETWQPPCFSFLNRVMEVSQTGLPYGHKSSLVSSLGS